jgi:hypothetical protein
VLIQAIELAGAVFIEMNDDAQIENALVQRAGPRALQLRESEGTTKRRGPWN